MITCEHCGSSDVYFLGTLGQLDHYRCRDCGMDCNGEELEDSDDEYYDDSMDGDHASALAAAGFGTDEDYGYFGGDD